MFYVIYTVLQRVLFVQLEEKRDSGLRLLDRDASN